MMSKEKEREASEEEGFGKSERIEKFVIDGDCGSSSSVSFPYTPQKKMKFSEINTQSEPNYDENGDGGTLLDAEPNYEENGDGGVLLDAEPQDSDVEPNYEEISDGSTLLDAEPNHEENGDGGTLLDAEPNYEENGDGGVLLDAEPQDSDVEPNYEEISDGGTLLDAEPNYEENGDGGALLDAEPQDAELNYEENGDGGTLLDAESQDAEPQDADYRYVPYLNADLENLILARTPRSEYWKFCSVSKRYLSFLKSGEIYKIRKDNDLREYSVFMLAGGETSWWAFDRQFESRRKLPILPTDYCFTSGDKETLCAGTHLIVSGKEIDGVVIWRYELPSNKWEKGPSMLDPRCLFASATCGSFAFVAGGIGMGSDRDVLNSAEKYNPEDQSWEPLPRMKQRREFCSGCYMDNKFYVIGGRDEKGNILTCGEAFDETKNTWEPIPDMVKGAPVSTSQSPPLLAVVNNELYSLEATSNELKVYLKKSNTWKKLGQVPVRADFNRGWGVAFKSLGNELLVIGASSISYAGHGMTIYTCRPNPDAEELQWRLIDSGRNRHSHFILNCSVMVA